MRRVEVLWEWRERWRAPEVRPLARRLAAELLEGGARTASPFGVVDGRIDLRGLQVDLLGATTNPMYRRLSVNHGHWDRLDLTGAGLSGLNWTALRVTDCVLDDAQLDMLRCWGVGVSDCVAHRASLRSAQIGAPAPGLARSSWRRVDLQGADLRHLHGNVVLKDADLRRARFGGTDLGWSDLSRVRFQGTVGSLTIGALPVDRRPPAWTLCEVDLSETRPRGLELVGVDLGSPQVDIRLPDDEEHWLVRDWSAFLDRVTANASSGLLRDPGIWVEHQRRSLGPRQSWGFVALRDCREYAGEPFVDLLRRSR